MDHQRGESLRISRNRRSRAAFRLITLTDVVICGLPLLRAAPFSNFHRHSELRDLLPHAARLARRSLYVRRLKVRTQRLGTHGRFESSRTANLIANVGQSQAAVERKKQMSHIQLYEQGDMDYSVENVRRETEFKDSKRNRPTHGRKRGKSPQSVNGIHRRRNRKMAW
jgi:hypothetical protein